MSVLGGLVLVLAAASPLTLTGTVTGERGGGVVPIGDAVVFFDDGPTPAKPDSVTITCSSAIVGPEHGSFVASADPAVVAVAIGTVLRVASDHAGVLAVRIEGADGRTILSATLVSRRQVTPVARLPAGRARVWCGATDTSAISDVLVLTHTAFTMTAPDGTFSLAGEAARVRTWHPAWGAVDMAATASTVIARPLF